ncbi:Pimeloyl-ACP methyl ester carboxylesterase [Fictibacillus solisalsi]|uniref:Pimeloyl-ACP methyl ester carboxylesterase n=1 Tax=Fictibacillus solisalsi TaxID=459525 RepID=A0A1H0C321_9BACL|nr:alpha/beta hydrolase [Fictibacillus solisalsi]SDN52268.1 Pimeloyl-ACP methyl ester carboxylesterase [Fictibacillus solisalsi]
MDLYYEASGSGKPIVLLHSGGADLRDWTFIAPLLAQKYKVITVDGRGAGLSPSPVSPANYVEDVLTLLNHLELDQVVLVGHSMGGQIATEFTLEYPERVAELILIAPSLSGYQYSEEFNQWMQKINSFFPDMEKMLELSLDAPSYRVVLTSRQKDLLVEMFRHHLKKIGEWKTFESVWPEPPAIERLEEIKARTLFILGEVELPDNQRIASFFNRLPDVRFTHLPEADHMLTLTHPNVVSRTITEFLEE